MRIAILGANGQLGSDLMRLLPGERIPLCQPHFEIRDAEQVRRVISDASPEVVVNCVAATNVDECESDPVEAFAVNALGALHAARAAAAVKARLVYISTDYVFGGDPARRTPYFETDLPGPVNVYGTGKLAGEALSAAYSPNCLIVRTSGLYGRAGARGKGGNFVETMLRLARGDAPLRVVADQTLSPTSTPALARALAGLIERGATGIVHAAAADACSWHEFAVAIMELSGTGREVAAISTAEFPRPARRPAYCALDSRRRDEFGAVLPPGWRTMLEQYLGG